MHVTLPYLQQLSSFFRNSSLQVLVEKLFSAFNEVNVSQMYIKYIGDMQLI
jgi:hypothetical protein